MINSTSFGLANTDTFRRASRMLFGRYGSNLQNPSKKMMEIYKPRTKGAIFIQPDQAGAEALVVSYLTPHGLFRDLFLNNIKSHTYVAAHIFANTWRVDWDFPDIDDILACDINLLRRNDRWTALAKIIKKCDIEYFVGKKSCHSLNYRMRPPTFREDVLKESEGKVVLSKIDSERIYDIYHNKLFTEISTKWWPEIEYQVRGSGYLFNLFGFPRYCQGPFIDADWRKLTAWVPQSTVGCITAIAFCVIQQFIEENGLAKWWHLCNDKHDSLLLECPEEDRDIAGRICASAIEQDLESPRGEKFKMRSEVQWGYNWAKQTEKNPEGMRELTLTE